MWFFSKDGSRMLLQDISYLIPHYKASQPRILQSIYLNSLKWIGYVGAKIAQFGYGTYNCTVDVLFLAVTKDFSPQCPQLLWSPSCILLLGHRWRYPRELGGRCVKLATHFHLMQRLRMSGPTPPLPHILSYSAQRPLYLKKWELYYANWCYRFSCLNFLIRFIPRTKNYENILRRGKIYLAGITKSAFIRVRTSCYELILC